MDGGPALGQWLQADPVERGLDDGLSAGGGGPADDPVWDGRMIGGGPACRA